MEVITVVLEVEVVLQMTKVLVVEVTQVVQGIQKMVTVVPVVHTMQGQTKVTRLRSKQVMDK